MGNKLKLTNSIHLECISLTASAAPNIEYTILTSDPSKDRRIYGLGVSSSDANTQNIVLYLNDGTRSYHVSRSALTANSGNSISLGPFDLQGNSLASPILGKRLDVMGVSYFNLPMGWSMTALYTGTQLSGTEAITFTSQGEIYDSSTHKFTSNPFEQTVVLTNATGLTETDLLSSVAYDRRVYSISALNKDTTSRPLSIKLKNGTKSYLLYTVNILANSGNTTTISAYDIFYDVNGYSTPFFTKNYEPDGGYYFNLPAGWAITGTLGGTIAIGASITIKTSGDTYE